MELVKQKGNLEKALSELKNDNNNAVAFVYENGYKEASEGILNGSVITIKDVFATKNAPTRSSSKILENFNPFYNATAVKKLLDAGAIATAKVNNDELALGGTGTYSAFGIVKNKLDPRRFSGGSSSGSVVTLTENVSIALGSDTGDSVRLPASFQGVVGFKPSYGAISRYGMFAYASSLDTVAYFAHNVNDIFAASKAMFGKDSKDMTSVNVELNKLQASKPKKVVALDFSIFCNSYVNEAFDKLLEKLENEQVEVIKIKPNYDILKAIKIVYQVVSFSEASSNLSNLTGISFGSRVNGNTWEEIMKNTRSERFGKMVQERLTLGSYFLYSENQEEIFIRAQKARRVIKDYIDSLQKQGDVVIYPAYRGIAPLFDEVQEPNLMDYILTGANLAGIPSITIPLGSFENMPFNLCLEKQIYKDNELLNYANYFEELIKGGN